MNRIAAVTARLLLLAAAVVTVLAATPGHAGAHPTLLFTTPAAETAEPIPPTVVVLVFSEPVGIGAGALAVLAATGVRVGFQPPITTRGGATVTARLTDTLPTGVYTVRWRVTGADGDLVEGQFRFAVGTAITAPATADDRADTPWPTAVLRWAMLAGLTLTAGSVVANLLVSRARRVNPALPAVPEWAGIGALVGAAAAAAMLVQLGAQTDTAFARSTPARLFLVQAVAFAVALIARAVRRTGWTAAALVVVVLAESVRAHPNIAAPGWGATLTAAHLTAAAVWAGTLVHVLHAAVVWRGHRGAVRWLVSGYARLAVWLVAAAAATGLVSALLTIAPPRCRPPGTVGCCWPSSAWSPPRSPSP